MGHNNVVSSYPKSIGISRVHGLSTGPPGFGVSQFRSTELRRSKREGLFLFFSSLSIPLDQNQEKNGISSSFVP